MHTGTQVRTHSRMLQTNERTNKQINKQTNKHIIYNSQYGRRRDWVVHPYYIKWRREARAPLLSDAVCAGLHVSPLAMLTAPGSHVLNADTAWWTLHKLRHMTETLIQCSVHLCRPLAHTLKGISRTYSVIGKNIVGSLPNVVIQLTFFYLHHRRPRISQILRAEEKNSSETCGAFVNFILSKIVPCLIILVLQILKVECPTVWSTQRQIRPFLHMY